MNDYKPPATWRNQTIANLVDSMHSAQQAAQGATYSVKEFANVCRVIKIKPKIGVWPGGCK